MSSFLARIALLAAALSAVTACRDRGTRRAHDDVAEAAFQDVVDWAERAANAFYPELGRIRELRGRICSAEAGVELLEVAAGNTYPEGLDDPPTEAAAELAANYRADIRADAARALVRIVDRCDTRSRTDADASTRDLYSVLRRPRSVERLGVLLEQPETRSAAYSVLFWVPIESFRPLLRARVDAGDSSARHVLDGWARRD